MDIVDFLKARESTPWRMLGDPGPTEAEIQEFLAAAVTAPDHGAIRPWRFIVVRGDAREALGEVFTRALLKRKPDADEATVEKDRDRMRRVPLLIVVAASIREDHPKVPPSEQLVATGLAAQAILLAAQARGYGGVILTGDHAYDPAVKAALGLKDKHKIVAFVYIGTPEGELRPKRRPDAAKFTMEWTGPVS
ncbi:MAG: nitroreductase [Alphaproteobacteria bacterium]|nr:nitroreductase [Alphaproteobacteria bacterium]